MKARPLWFTLGLLLLAGVGYRALTVLAARRGEKGPAEHSPLVHTVKVGRTSLVERVSCTGSVRPRNEVDIYPKLPGRVESLAVEVGEHVRPGQTIAVLEHKEVAWQAKMAQAAVELARAGLDGAKLEHERTMALVAAGSATQAMADAVRIKLAAAEAQLAQAEAGAGLAEQTLANATIVAPIAGVVSRRPATLGMQLGAQSLVATIADVSVLKFEAAVDATTAARLRKGNPAEIRVDALPGQVFTGHLTLLAPALDATTRRASIEIEIDPSPVPLLPNTFAHADVATGKLDNALAVARAAVVEAAGGALVYRVRNGRAEAVRPKLGDTDGALVAVHAGLEEGDEVAVTAVAALSDGAVVRAAPAEAASEQRAE
jgi:membrane fusion protein, multidrug efflux system